MEISLWSLLPIATALSVTKPEGRGASSKIKIAFRTHAVTEFYFHMNIN